MALLDKYRKQIDKIDKKIIDYLAKRYQVVKKVGFFKKKKGLKPFDKKRFQEVLKTRISFAEEKGLPKELIKKIYQIIHQFSLEIEKKI
jgi:chorismate mutase